MDTNGNSGQNAGNSKILALAVVLIVAVAVVWAMVEKKSPSSSTGTNNNSSNGTSQSEADVPSLVLSPSSFEVSKGEEFTVDVLLDTVGKKIDGIDVFYLRFNPAVVQVVDADKAKAGVQIATETMLPITVSNTADNTKGTVQFSQVTTGGQTFTGQGQVASITFKAVGSGNTNLAIDYEAGDTTDSNISSETHDVLGAVVNASVTVE